MYVEFVKRDHEKVSARLGNWKRESLLMEGTTSVFDVSEERFRTVRGIFFDIQFKGKLANSDVAIDGNVSED